MNKAAGKASSYRKAFDAEVFAHLGDDTVPVVEVLDAEDCQQ